MIRQSARTGRTRSTSSIHRDVIHAHGQSGSNQNCTSSGPCGSAMACLLKKKQKQLSRTYLWLDRHATRWALRRSTGLAGGCRGARYR